MHDHQVLIFVALMVFLFGLVSKASEKWLVTGPMVFVVVGILVGPLAFDLFVLQIAAYFLCGRENLIPDMFRSIVSRLRASGADGLEGLLYYLDRHIEVDDELHGPAAERMLTYLCDGQRRRWAQAHKAAVRALKSRLGFWEAIANAVRES